jgi:hypothetical protein
MTQTVIVCDRCSSEIQADRTRLTVEGSAVALPWPTDQGTGRPTLDLCSACLGHLGSWLAEGEPARC